MAVSFNGIFLSREASLMMPTTHFNTVSLKDVTPDHLVMERGGTYSDTDAPILPNKDNLGLESITMWHPNTELNIDFNGTLEGGTLNTDGDNLKGLVIRRTSSRSNFTEWEDVAVFPLTAADIEQFSRSYDDIFVESGVIYKYAIQTVVLDVRGPVFSTASTMIDYSYSWLIGQNEKQLMFAYNTELSDYKTVVKDTITETIGSKYPYIVRNSKVGYRQFNFSATITQLMDISKAMMNDENPFVVDPNNPNTNLPYYNFYKENGLDPQNNYILEREFRTELEAFLNDGQPKVFKSDTEGLILVRITDVSLSPKNELGRTIYDMSCTMTEIGTVDFNSLVQYSIKGGGSVDAL